ncbi:hypothetical protein GF342_04890 [Candidatus Woesearchaeota archaeon]|nr:hypothetical protein [Candidatus Woesearchaeota archaeon]
MARALEISIIGLLLIALFLPFVFADSTAFADKLNYFSTVENHTVYITNNEGVNTTYTVTVPAGWTGFDGTGCTEAAGTITCANVTANATVTYLLQNPSSPTKYTVTTVSTTGGTTNNVSFLAIPDNEIFHTLVEYGRGRGNYFFDSYTDTSSSSTAGSGKTGIGCPYLPNGTLFELNYLHKLFNTKQYFHLADADATDATWTCTYSNDTVVREHLVTSINRGALWTVSYKIDEIEGSWERMGYLGQNFFAGTYTVGQNITVNCTDIVYTLAAAGGNLSVAEDSFTLQFVDREPFAVTASSSSTIGNGTSEVLITYVINNTDIHNTDTVIIEIEAPAYSQFIGTRGELWGVGRDKFTYELTDMPAGASETITLVARFDTSAAGSITAVNLTDGVKVKYVTCWEWNAYNPQEYTQLVSASGVGTAPVNMSVPSEIVGVQNRINLIYDLVIDLNTTITQINTTVTQIETFVEYFNSTTFNGTTLQDILDQLGNFSVNVSNEDLLAQINSSRDDILTRIQYLQEFDEELVFLVTDSFVLQDKARDEIAQGDRQAAMNSLRESNERLREAADRLATLQSQAEMQLSSSSFSWWPVVFVFVLIGIIGAVLLMRSRKGRGKDFSRRYR